MSGILDFLRGAIAPAAAADAGYMQGQEKRRLLDQAEADRQLALKRQATLDQQQAELHQSQIAENAARARNYDRGATQDNVTWRVDENGNLVPLPRSLPKDAGSSATGASSSASATTTATPTSTPAVGSGPLATVKSAVQSTAQSPAPTAQDTTKPKFVLGQPSGVKAPPLKPAPTPKIDPNSEAGISADSAKAVNRARARQQYPTPSRGTATGASQDRLNALAALKTAMAQTPRPSKTPAAMPFLFTKDPKTGKLSGTPNPAFDHRDQDPAYQKAVADSTEYDRSTLAPLRQNVYDATVGDRVKIGADNPKPDAPAPTTSSAGSSGDIDLGKGSTPPANHAAAQAEYDAAGAQLQTVLKSSLSPELKAKAQAAYNARIKTIAGKYGELKS